VRPAEDDVVERKRFVKAGSFGWRRGGRLEARVSSSKLETRAST
jgi:hypothetical protein